MQLEIERQALQMEKDKASKERLANLEKELADLREQASHLHTRWENEKKGIQEIRDIKEQMDQTEIEIERAERNAELEKAARLRYGTLNELECGWQQLKRTKELQSESLLKEEVDAEEISQIVSNGPAFRFSPVRRRDAKADVHGERLPASSAG